ncbi:hypothetical protein AVEN_217900-1 [Araneus ventricosus]|uniref:Uncharacterized protein n=1 Tax=Araneus ventricosus TaxID=182803 RepID=A0A4Y2EFU1_ARAVE|nr:hypothetical protein AVEN_217900-1 [Araneus ventricosus]
MTRCVRECWDVCLVIPWSGWKPEIYLRENTKEACRACKDLSRRTTLRETSQWTRRHYGDMTTENFDLQRAESQRDLLTETLIAKLKARLELPPDKDDYLRRVPDAFFWPEGSYGFSRYT